MAEGDLEEASQGSAFEPEWPIHGFRVSGFRTLDDVQVIPRGPLTVICGPNNSGKSSFLAALQDYNAIRAAAVGGSAPRTHELDPQARFHVGVDVTSPQFQRVLSEKTTDRPDDAERFTEFVFEHLDGVIWLAVSQDETGYRLEKEAVAELVTALPDADAGTRRTIASIGAPNTHPDKSWAQSVAQLVLSVPVTVSAIPDVRRAATEALSSSNLQRLAHASAKRTTGERHEPWTTILELILQDVFGTSSTYEVQPAESGGAAVMRLRIDGQDDVPLEEVGAGVREVVAIAHEALASEQAKTVLCIEEPENCLHPGAVRRLLESLVRQTGVQLFVSTHSAAVVNAGPSAVVHLTRGDGRTTSRQVERPSERFAAIRSLGYRPADVVLTPCAVWVEGPSDRMYLSTWLETEDLVEGRDYQIMFFGGALGAHITPDADAETESPLVAVRNLGRRCVILADSDRDKPRGALKPHVKHYRTASKDDPDALVIITPGREVENYLEPDLASAVLTSLGKSPLAKGADRYARFLEGIPIPKVRFAAAALEKLDGEVPEAARDDVRRIAKFIKESVAHPS